MGGSELRPYFPGPQLGRPVSFIFYIPGSNGAQAIDSVGYLPAQLGCNIDFEMKSTAREEWRL